MKDLLVVVDMQNGFVNHHSEHILPQIIELVSNFREKGKDVVATRFINTPTSGYVRWIKWHRLMQSPEIDLIEPIGNLSLKTFDKQGIYSPFSEDFIRFIKESGTERIFVCGIATDSCVLKTAVDAFELGIEPIVVEDACASHAGNAVHEAGMLLIKRFIGRGQVLTVEDVIHKLF